MKIKFITLNVSVEKPNSIDEVFLCKNNMRYELCEKPEELEASITDEKDYDEKQILKKLLQSDDDYSKFLGLLNSINSSGFENKGDDILLVKKNNKYFVAEGNRRVACIKLINGKLDFPEFDSIGNDKNDSLYKRARRNYHKCIDCVKELIKKEQDEYVIFYDIPKDIQELYIRIFKKHISVDSIGFKPWSRGNYLARILSLFPYGLPNKDDSKIKKICREIRRDFKSFTGDYKSAMFVYSVLYYKKEKSKKIENYNDREIIKCMIDSRNLSSLEPQHSYAKIKKIACEILSIDKTEWNHKYFNYVFTKDVPTRIQFFPNKLSAKEIFSFIYDKWKSGIINTRLIQNKNKEKFKYELCQLLLGNSSSQKVDEVYLRNTDEFANPDSVLETIKNKKYGGNVDRFIKAYELKKLSNNWKNLNRKFLKFKSNEPKFVFSRLIEQICSIEDKFLHAKAATIRAIIEQLKLWMLFYVYKEETDENKMNKYLSSFATGRITDVTRDFYNNPRVDVRKLLIAYLKFEKTDDIDGCLELFKYEVSNRLNDYIHALHIIYIRDIYENHLEFLKEIQKKLLFLLDNLRVEEFEKLNQQIMKFIIEINNNKKKN